MPRHCPRICTSTLEYGMYVPWVSKPRCNSHCSESKISCWRMAWLASSEVTLTRSMMYCFWDLRESSRSWNWALKGLIIAEKKRPYPNHKSFLNSATDWTWFNPGIIMYEQQWISPFLRRKPNALWSMDITIAQNSATACLRSSLRSNTFLNLSIMGASLPILSKRFVKLEKNWR